jgi:hypothetical protein
LTTTVFVRVAGRTVRLTFTDPRPRDSRDFLHRFFAAAPASSSMPLSLETHLCPGSALPRIVASRWARQHLAPGDCADLIQASDRGWMTILVGPRSHCHLFVKRSKLDKAFWGGLGLFLRYRIPPEEGTCFHAAGVKLDGRAILFLGPSGAGKTTLAIKARLARLPLLSDEQIFITWRGLGKSFIAHGTPFGRMSDGPLQAPLGAVCFLRQAPALSLTPLGGARAAAMAWSDSLYGSQFVDQSGRLMIVNNNVADAARRGRIFARWVDLFSAVPCFEMGCPLDFCNWDLLARVAGRGRATRLPAFA